MAKPHRYGFLIAFIMPLLAWTGVVLGGWWHGLVPAFVFLVVPLADLLVGIDRSNVSENLSSELKSDGFYLSLLRIWVPVQLAFLVWGSLWISEAGIGIPEWILFTLSTGLITGGIGITIAHELGHKRSRTDRFCAQTLLMTVCYMHFTIEHNRGHHVRVATPDDPATARLGENAYLFCWRSVSGGFFHAWQLERQRGSVLNRLIYLAAPLACCVVLTFIGFTTGPESRWFMIPVFFLIQALVAIMLLELVNYIEHYGMLRRALPGGKYEPVNPLHSWNTGYLISNLLLFQLQRHSDHHAHASKDYQVLDHVEESPQLPFGYPLMILIAVFPPLWFRIMDRRLVVWRNQSLQAAQ